MRVHDHSQRSVIHTVSRETQWAHCACYCNLGGPRLPSAQVRRRIRHPACTILHTEPTMSFNQDQSSAKKHMGPTDAALIPLGFGLTVGFTASLVPRSGRCQTGHKHEGSCASIGLWRLQGRKGGRRKDQSPSLESDHRVF